MEDLVIMDVLKCETYLCKPVEQLIFGKVVWGAVLIGLVKALF